MRKLVVLSICLLAAGYSASADTFQFTYASLHSSAQGFLVANANGDGSFTALSGSGTYTNPQIGERSIELIANPMGATGTADVRGLGGVVFTYNDQFFPGADDPGKLDIFGLAFSVDMSPGPADVLNLSRDGASYCDFFGNWLFIDHGSINFTPTPEPSSILLLGGGLFVAAQAIRRSRNRA